MEETEVLTCHDHGNCELCDQLEDERDALREHVTALNELQLVEQREHAARVAELEAQRDAILQESRTWAMEAKTQRQTVNEVCSVLGGIADWGPVVERVAELEADRDRLRDFVRGFLCVAAARVRAELASGEISDDQLAQTYLDARAAEIARPAEPGRLCEPHAKGLRAVEHTVRSRRP